MTKVSVVTVVLNDPQGLARTLESIFSQEEVDIESIVVDGNSKHETLDVIKSYSEKIYFWLSETDEGIFHAMDKGIQKSTGDWVIFMNAGDVFCSDRILKQLDLESSLGYGVVYGAKIMKGETIDPMPLDASMKRGVIFACHQAMLFNKRLLLGELHYHRDYKIYGDFELVARLYKNGFRFLRKNIAVANFEGGGVSSFASKRKRMEKYLAIYQIFGAFWLIRAIFIRVFKT